MWPMTSWATNRRRCRRVDAAHDRRGQRQQSAHEVLHLLRDLLAGDALLHERLVDVEVEQPDLGVGHLRERVAVDAKELQERDARQPGAQRGARCRRAARRPPCRSAARARAEGSPSPSSASTAKLGLQAGLARGVLERDLAAAGAEEVLDAAERQRAALLGFADLLRTVARAPAAARRAGPARRPPASTCRRSAGAGRRGPTRGASPASCRRGGRPPPRSASPCPQHDDGGALRSPPPCGQCGPLPRPWGARRHQWRRRRLAGGAMPPTLRPFALVGVGQGYSLAGALSSGREASVRVTTEFALRRLASRRTPPARLRRIGRRVDLEALLARRARRAARRVGPPAGRAISRVSATIASSTPETRFPRPVSTSRRVSSMAGADSAPSRRSSLSTPSSIDSSRCDTDRTRRVSRSRSAADGRFSAPNATACAWVGLLARLEDAPDRRRHDRALEQLGGELADRVLTGPRDALAQPCGPALSTPYRGHRSFVRRLSAEARPDAFLTL